MKYIVTKENYIQFVETDDSNQITRQLGFGIDGVTYVVHNNNIKFYLKEDYFYKNSVWSIDLPAQINGETYDKDTIGDGLAGIYDPSIALAVTSVNGKKGEVWLTAANVDAYSRSQTDNMFDTKADKETTYTKSEVNSLLDGKVDDGYCYSKGEVDGLLNNKANVGDSYTKSETDNLLNSKADKADTYTKQEVDDKLNLKANQSNTYTKQEVDDAIANVDVTEQLQNYYNKTEIDEKLANVRVDAYTKAETDNLLNAKANKFTDVDDIMLVDQLPETPNDRILYLIPISAE